MLMDSPRSTPAIRPRPARRLPLLKLWGKADRDLPELQQIHKQLAAGR